MHFFLDHDVPVEIARVLRNLGHDVLELHEVLPTTAPDEEVFDYGRANNRYTVTCNRDDFLPLAARQSHPGLIILIRRLTRQAECAHIVALLDRAGEAGLNSNINFA